MRAVILGSESDIATALVPFLKRDGWEVAGWKRGDGAIPAGEDFCGWDLVICAIGRVAPVGLWHEQNALEWDACVYANAILPVQLLIDLWPDRGANPMVCFMAGSNPQKPMAGYSAYNAGKMALLKICEQLDYETPDAKFFALAPGYVPTKIHRATLEKGWRNERIERGDAGTPIEDIYRTLKWCIEQPKDIIGGRNICVSDLTTNSSEWLRRELCGTEELFKLRRVQ